MPTSVEVIDVDLLDDDAIQLPTASSSRAASRTQSRQLTETISLLEDSDDEIQVLHVDLSRRNERLFSPHPLPPMRMSPAVRTLGYPPGFPPQAPRAFRSDGAPPVVRAADREFIPERPRHSPSPVAGPSNSANNNQQGAPPPAARSHHVPSLGLGGGLIANNRARLAQERRQRIQNPLRRIFPVAAFGSFGDFLGMRFPSDDEWGGLYPGDDYYRPFDRSRPPLREKEHYLPAYTHPAPPETGFTHDFAPSSQEQNSSTFLQSSSNPIVIKDESETKGGTSDESPKTLLVCARCLDPLVLNAGLSPGQAVQRRIWGLRCGHLIDGKCMNEIGRPAVVVDRKGKGKAKAEPTAFIPYGEEPSSARLQDEANIPREASPEPNAIRSRLRSQAHSASASVASTAHAPGSSSSDGVHLHPPPSPTNNRKRKRGPVKGSNKKPKVEEEFEWHCPVASCGKAHMSVKINGVWGPEKERQLPRRRPAIMLQAAENDPRGAIPVFA